MIWFLALHIITLLIWCGSLLYLPALIASIDARCTEITLTPKKHDSVARFLFTLISTPAALLAIVSGTAIFLVTQQLAAWLIVKLTLVTALVVAHCLVGVMVLRAENGQSVRAFCWLLLAAVAVLVVAIMTMVLSKPSIGELPWTL